MLAYMKEVCELEKDRKQGWEESPIKKTNILLVLHPDIPQDCLNYEVKYFVIPACLA